MNRRHLYNILTAKNVSKTIEEKTKHKDDIFDAKRVIDIRSMWNLEYWQISLRRGLSKILFINKLGSVIKKVLNLFTIVF